MDPIVNHIGLCVSDVARSRRFYEDVLGFEHWREIEPPDAMVSKLIDIPPPIGVTAVYLRRAGFVLELMHYADAGTVSPARDRVMNELGLTHISVSVDDIDASAAKVVECGGSVLEHTNVGAAVMIRDPDGQLLELLPMAYRDTLSG
jgi:catechol 2,3-dioxygenase-like lactoylglutathione lyase family enzyme